MVTVFNRKELFLTTDTAVYGRICQQLEDAGIQFDVTSRNIFTNGWDDPRTGRPSTGVIFEYKIYVRKKDFELAQGAMATRP